MTTATLEVSGADTGSIEALDERGLEAALESGDTEAVAELVEELEVAMWEKLMEEPTPEPELDLDALEAALHDDSARDALIRLADGHATRADVDLLMSFGVLTRDDVNGGLRYLAARNELYEQTRGASESREDHERHERQRHDLRQIAATLAPTPTLAPTSALRGTYARAPRSRRARRSRTTRAGPSRRDPDPEPPGSRLALAAAA